MTFSAFSIFSFHSFPLSREWHRQRRLNKKIYKEHSKTENVLMLDIFVSLNFSLSILITLSFSVFGTSNHKISCSLVCTCTILNPSSRFFSLCLNMSHSSYLLALNKGLGSLICFNLLQNYYSIYG